MSQKCRITGRVVNPDGLTASGRIIVYLRAPKMTFAQQIALDGPIVQVPISPSGEVNFFLEPNALILPKDSYYEVHIHTHRDYWREKWIIPVDTPERQFDSFRNTEISPWSYTESLSHEADTYNPHLVTIEQVLQAQPDYRIPGARIDLPTPLNGGNAAPEVYQFITITEGEVLFTLPTAFDISIKNSLEVTLNGLLQKEGPMFDYVIINSTTLQFNRPLYVGETITVKILIAA